MQNNTIEFNTRLIAEKNMDITSLHNKFKALSLEAKELYLPSIVPINFVRHKYVSPLEFHRNWVSLNIPVLMKGSINHWPALKKWDTDYLRKILGEKVISVAVTPDGYADAIAESLNGRQYFVEPEERKMTLSQFLDVMKNPNAHPGVFYIQKQNSNFTEEFTELMQDVDKDILWASEAFGAKPTATNLWIGDQRAVTSMHKDPFENMYAVISGYKDFILLPPTDLPWVPYEPFQLADYKEITPGNFEIIPRNSSAPSGSVEDVPWICIDPLNPDFKKYPLYRNASPVTVRVEAGDVLYLPSLWFHHVRQSHACIAINYWYDMQFDIKYAYFKLLESLVNLQ